MTTNEFSEILARAIGVLLIVVGLLGLADLLIWEQIGVSSLEESGWLDVGSEEGWQDGGEDFSGGFHDSYIVTYGNPFSPWFSAGLLGFGIFFLVFPGLIGRVLIGRGKRK